MIATVNSRISKVENGIAQVKLVQTEVKKSDELMKKEIRTFCEQGRQIWDERERKLLAEADKITRSKEKILSHQSKDLSSTSQDINKFIREAEKLLLVKQETEILTHGNVLRKQLYALSEKIHSLEPETDSNFGFMFDSSIFTSIASAGHIGDKAGSIPSGASASHDQRVSLMALRTSVGNGLIQAMPQHANSIGDASNPPGHITAIGDGLIHASPGTPAIFTIVAKDEQKQVGNHRFKVTIENCQPIVKIINNQDGTFSVHYVIPKEEEATASRLSVLHNGNHIYGSPFNVSIIQECQGTFVRMWGSKGKGEGQFHLPYCTAANCASVYVGDANDRIQVFQHDGTFIRMWGTSGTDRNQFNKPYSLALDDRALYVADYGNHRVQVFDLNGKFLRSWGTYGIGHGEFNRPTGIDTYGNEVYVTDHSNHRIQVFQKNGTFVRTWGSSGLGEGRFRYPRGLSVDGNDVYVVDCENNRIQIFGLDGNLKKTWGSKGKGEGQFSLPRDIKVSNGVVYVADYGNRRIQVFRPDGTFLRMWDTVGKGSGLAMDGTTIYVTEHENHRIESFH